MPCADPTSEPTPTAPAGMIASAPGLTPFQRRVYQELTAVPAGRVVAYATLGKAVGCASARAVGQALKCNPLAPQVPCHRVIAASGRIGGFEGQRGGAALERKRSLLAQEGVFFDPAGKLLDQSRLLSLRVFSGSVSRVQKRAD